MLAVFLSTFAFYTIRFGYAFNQRERRKQQQQQQNSFTLDQF